MTPSQKCKAAGLNSLAEVSRMTKAPQCTLYVWAKNKPELFKAVVAGCAVIKHEE